MSVLRTRCGYKLTKAQVAILSRLSRQRPAVIYVKGSQIMSAKALERIGLVRETGATYVTGSWWSLTDAGIDLVDRLAEKMK